MVYIADSKGRYAAIVAMLPLSVCCSDLCDQGTTCVIRLRLV